MVFANLFFNHTTTTTGGKLSAPWFKTSKHKQKYVGTDTGTYGTVLFLTETLK
jgi:hypothetical protein